MKNIETGLITAKVPVLPKRHASYPLISSLPQYPTYFHRYQAQRKTTKLKGRISVIIIDYKNETDNYNTTQYNIRLMKETPADTAATNYKMANNKVGETASLPSFVTVFIKETW